MHGVQEFMFGGERRNGKKENHWGKKDLQRALVTADGFCSDGHMEI